ncbi:hypothetical protein NEOLI_003735 [Neolecta irregularis DAH-3]|uniref:XRCC4 coiled-coil domain-containing protein n=1 Tax=Neolecta irregularis (strain DAH-3) TaxID=1198029 RepID=A0A1U7LP87_NEOID|nr:hypothetical protein NEOLI_003735 [Neolecta irregularis DAH-3]|eukprot:OLL24449.1 hypothetical protein NEOLI_003735 [Neolecta irregularis DAH-3]
MFCLVPQTNSPTNLVLNSSEYNGVLSLKVTDGRVADFGACKTESFDCSTEEWESIIRQMLLGSSQKSSLEQNLYLDAVAETDTVLLRIRKESRAGILARLGSIHLHRDRQEFDIYNWMIRLLETRSSCEVGFLNVHSDEQNELYRVTLENRNLLNDSAELTQHINTITKAKQDYETELIAKFTNLLNSKKKRNRQLRKVVDSIEMPRKRIHSPPSKLTAQIQTDTDDDL